MQCFSIDCNTFYVYVQYILLRLLRQPSNIAKQKGQFTRTKGSYILLWIIFKTENSIFIIFKKSSFPNSRYTFCLDKCFSCYIVVDMFVRPGAF